MFGLGYFLMSVDLIPDVIPVVGFLDDALVVAEIVYLLSGDLQRFRAHKAARPRESSDPDDRGSSIAGRPRRDRGRHEEPQGRRAA